MSVVARAKVEAVEERDVVPRVVQRFEFRRIEKAIGPQPLTDRKLPDRVRAAADVDIAGRTLERAVAERRAAGRLRLIEPGLGHDVHHQAALVAVFGRRHARDDLHRLHGVRRDLIRVQAALLVGDRLVVDRELRLRVVADRMEEAVRVGDDAG